MVVLFIGDKIYVTLEHHQTHYTLNSYYLSIYNIS